MGDSSKNPTSPFAQQTHELAASLPCSVLKQATDPSKNSLILSSLNTQVREKWKSFLAGFEPSQAKQTGFEINTGLLPFIQQLRLEQQKFDFLTPLKKLPRKKTILLKTMQI